MTFSTKTFTRPDGTQYHVMTEDQTMALEANGGTDTTPPLSTVFELRTTLAAPVQASSTPSEGRSTSVIGSGE